MIGPVEPAQVDVLIRLLEEFEIHYGSTEFEPFEEREAQVRDALFGTPPAAFALLAWDGTRPVGLASYSFLWPSARVSRSLYLKEPYVTQTHRRRGVGTQLVVALTEIARTHRCSRMECTTDRDSQIAQRFYARLGMPVNQDKLFYRTDL